MRRADNAKVPGSIPGNTNLFVFLHAFFFRFSFLLFQLHKNIKGFFLVFNVGCDDGSDDGDDCDGDGHGRHHHGGCGGGGCCDCGCDYDCGFCDAVDWAALEEEQQEQQKEQEELCSDDEGGDEDEP